MLIIYKILIADDEVWIRKNLEQMISWEEYGLEFLEPAVDGEDVLNKIEENRPDILITDINMPFVNGVDLLNIISEKYPEIVTFVVSGYDNFEYVRNTFLAGAINYLIKPISKIDLIGALSKALTVIAERQEKKEEEESRRMKLVKASSVLQDYELSKFLEKEEVSFAPSVGFSEADDFNGMYLILIKVHDLKKISRQYNHDRNLVSYNIKKEVGEIIGKEEIVFNNVYRSNEFLIISKGEKEDLKRQMDILVIKLSEKYHSIFTVCIGKKVYSMESVHMAYVENISLLMQRSFKKENEIIMWDCQKKELQSFCFKYQEYESRLRYYMNGGNRKLLEKLIFEDMGFNEERIQNLCYLEVKQNMKHLLMVLENQHLSYLTAVELADLNDLVMLSDNVIDSLDYSALRQVILEVLDMIFQKEKEKSNTSIKNMVKEAVVYVDQNYFEEITLTSLAEKYGIESSYFSKLFRNETGKNLVLYITEKRIEKAKEYIRKGDIKLTEVAFMVGYDDYSYFNRVFRKITGMSPRNYRIEIVEKKEM